MKWKEECFLHYFCSFLLSKKYACKTVVNIFKVPDLFFFFFFSVENDIYIQQIFL